MLTATNDNRPRQGALPRRKLVLAAATTREREYPMDGPDEAPVVMPFGKYKGRVISDIPQDYLEWFADNVKTKPVLAEAVAKALGRPALAQSQGQSQRPGQSSHGETTRPIHNRSQTHSWR